MLQTLMLAALSVAREREQGTFDQLLVTPLTPLQILIGKALPAILVGMVQSTIIFLIILFWFEIPMNGSVWLLYLGGLLVFTTAAVGIGLSISAVSLNMQQAMLYTFMLIMPLMLLSGLLTPVRNMPENPADRDLCEPAALRHRSCAASIWKAPRFGDICLQLRSAAGRGCGHAAARRLAVPQPPRLSITTRQKNRRWLKIVAVKLLKVIVIIALFYLLRGVFVYVTQRL
jgi:ABC-type transport system involved in multi-copper enzyme maturation permease subunit